MTKKHCELNKNTFINSSNCCPTLAQKAEITMELSIIKFEEQYQPYLNRVDALFDKNIVADSSNRKKPEESFQLIKQYEDENHAIPLPNAIEAIKIKMEDLGVRNKDLVGKIGSKGYISSLLNKRKPLTLEIAKIFHKELNIPADVVLA